MRYHGAMGKPGQQTITLWRRPPPRMGRAAGGIVRDRRGASAIEFALIAAPFAALMVAVLQISLTFFAQQVLETTAEKTVRQMITGEVQRSGLTASQFKTNVCAKLPSFMDCAKLMIDVRQATSFDGIDTSPPTITYNSDGTVKNSWEFKPGGQGAINVVKIMYLWPELSAPFGFNLANTANGKRLLVAVSVFKTEPYIE
ncbi:TadE/TadG family type IV pilus assembly protein [Sphingomonas sp. DT-204]|uniref:TadE/TadG family type IV pilus assembly protein n=1 Tax=Sphingomonas sp. DT-204 TaxID=3396166 RepID=UPI003F1C4221